MMFGFTARTCSYVRPYRSRRSRMRFVMKTSAVLARRRTSSGPPGLSRETVMERLPRLSSSKA